MKKIAFFAILLAIPAILLAQDESRFSTDGASVMWQNVYQTQLDSAAVVDGLIASGHFDGIILTRDGFTCRIIPHEVDYRGAGMKRGLTSMYLLDGELEGRAVVQIREGRYRVTVCAKTWGSYSRTPLISCPGRRKLFSMRWPTAFRISGPSPGS